jgi:hypothetical protein
MQSPITVSVSELLAAGLGVMIGYARYEPPIAKEAAAVDAVLNRAIWAATPTAYSPTQAEQAIDDIVKRHADYVTQCTTPHETFGDLYGCEECSRAGRAHAEFVKHAYYDVGRLLAELDRVRAELAEAMNYYNVEVTMREMLEEKLTADQTELVRVRAERDALRDTLRDGWISVAERLPQADGKYHVFYQIPYATGFYDYQDILAFSDGVFGESDFVAGFLANERVTHWRALPESPTLRAKLGDAKPTNQAAQSGAASEGKE